MRQRRHGLQVSTFPFLAVLLCAMGSLILLLLVIDRRARVVARARAVEAAARTAVEDEQQTRARVAELERRRQALHALLAEQDQDLQGQARVIQQKVGAASQALVKEQTSEEQLRQGLLAKIARLTQRQAAEVGRQKRAEQDAQMSEAAQKELSDLTFQLLKLEETLLDLKAAKRQNQERFSLVPYRGRRGDNRRPIYLECQANGLVFHPDRLTLQGLTMTPETVRAEVDRRLTRQREQFPPSQEDAAAYLLMLVRPDGITTYYQTLASLEGLNVDYGYEFVEADWILDFPEQEDAAPQPWMVQAPTPSVLATSEKRLPPPPAGSAALIFHPERASAGPAWHGINQGSGGESMAASPGSDDPRGPLPFPSGRGGNHASGNPKGDPSSLSIAGSSPVETSGMPTFLPKDAVAPGGSGHSEFPGSIIGRPTGGGGSGYPSGPSLGLAQNGTVPSGGTTNAKPSSVAPDGANPAGAPTGISTPVRKSAESATSRPEEQTSLTTSESPGLAHGSPTISGNGGGTGGTGGSAPGSGPASSADSGEGPNIPGISPLPIPAVADKPRQPPRPVPRFGNRDWFIYIECRADVLILIPTGQPIAAADLHPGQPDDPLLSAVRQLIARRQASVRPGEPPYRPLIRFRVQRDGLRSYFLAYPALESLHLPLAREDVYPGGQDSQPKIDRRGKP
jgi:hypothetical protein